MRTASRPTAPVLESLEPYRSELLAHCYRMLGSLPDAEDVVQELMTRAWGSLPAFEERSSLRTWLYQIGTNLCIDQLRRVRRRRELPVNTGTRIGADDPLPAPTDPAEWVGPFPDHLLSRPGNDNPEARYLSAESIRLAFVVALQHLPPQQRAIFLLREVLGWRAHEVAATLGISEAAVSSALHRARDVMAKKDVRPARGKGIELPSAERRLLERYVRAWTNGDAGALANLLSDGVTFSMPPNPVFFRGKSRVIPFITRIVFGESRLTRKLVATRANGTVAFGVYARRIDEKGPYRAHTLHVVTTARGKVTDIVAFHDAAAFASFGLSPEAK